MSRPSQIQFLSRFAGAYDPVVRLMGFEPLWRAVAEMAAPRRGEPMLDVCTGTGGVAYELAHRGARVIGVDLARGMLRQAEAKRNGTHDGNPSFVQMDARRIGFRDRTFPLVTCSMALHEMAEGERMQVLSEIARVAGERVIIAEYRVPRSRTGALLFRAARFFEYFESDDFERFVSRDFRARLDTVGLVPSSPLDVGGYRVWSCRVRA
jgi:ubiquinone/menaquinone biosynthesis C-methylase UbiE